TVIFLNSTVLMLRVLLDLDRLTLLLILVAHHRLVHDQCALAECFTALGVLDVEQDTLVLTRYG
ncbi:major facilitator superfamily transporter, partial [Colletotrichum scovillei]